MVEVVERVGVDEDDEKREGLREESGGGGAVLNNLSGSGIERIDRMWSMLSD